MNPAGPLCSKALAPAGVSGGRGGGRAGAFASQEGTWRALVEAPAKRQALLFSTALVSIRRSVIFLISMIFIH